MCLLPINQRQTEINGFLYTVQTVPEEFLTSYEEEVLRRNIVHGIVPVLVIHREGNVEIGFREKEYQPILLHFREERMHMEHPGEYILYYGMEVVRILLDAEEHFLPKELFRIEENTVFYDPVEKIFRVLPVPAFRYENTDNPSGQIASFLTKLGNEISDPVWIHSSKRVLEAIKRRTDGLRDLAGLLEELQRELYLERK